MEDRIKHIFKFMEYDYISDAQHSLIVSYEKQFNEKGWLSRRQMEILEDIFEKAAEKVEWSK